MRERIWEKIAYYSRKYVMVRIPAVIMVACVIFIRLLAKYRSKERWYRRVAVATAISLFFVSVIPAPWRLFAEEDNEIVEQPPEVRATDDSLISMEVVDLSVTSGSAAKVAGYALRVSNKSEYLLTDDLLLRIEQNTDGRIVFLNEVAEKEAEFEPSLEARFDKDLMPGEYEDFFLKSAPEDFEIPVEEEVTEPEETLPEEVVSEELEEFVKDIMEESEGEPSEETEGEEEASETPEEPVVESEESSARTEEIPQEQQEPEEVPTEPAPVASLSVSEHIVKSVAAPESPVYPVINIYRLADPADPSSAETLVSGYSVTAADMTGISAWVEAEEEEQAPAVPAVPAAESSDQTSSDNSNNNKTSTSNTSAAKTGSEAKNTASTDTGAVASTGDDSKDADAGTADSDPASDEALVTTAPVPEAEEKVYDEQTLSELSDNIEKYKEYLEEQEKEEKKEEENKVDEVTEEERPADIISVKLPTTFAIPMYGAGSDIDVMSEPIVIENNSDFPVDVNISSVNMTIDRTMTKEEIKSVVVPTDGETVYDLEKAAKTCHLNLQILINDIKQAFSIDEGITNDITSFTLSRGGDGSDSASMCLYGEATYGLTGMWDDGDLKVGITFEFKKHEEDVPKEEQEPNEERDIPREQDTKEEQDTLTESE